MNNKSSSAIEFSSYFWPTEIELCLIRSAIGKNEKEVLKNFTKWADWHGFTPSRLTPGQVLPQVYDSLEDGSKKLLPLVYSNFRRLQIEHPIVSQFVSFHRYTTYKNRMLESQMELILEQLNHNNVPYYIRKGLAYLPLYYQDYGARPTNDIDIVLDPKYVDTFLEARSSEGWESLIDWKLNPISDSLNHAISLKKQHFELDVHCRFGRHPIDQKWDQLIMESAIPYGKIVTLPHEYHLIDTLVHGYAYNQVRPIRWACDAHKIIGSGSIDWNLIIQFAEGCHDSIPIFSGLKFLQMEGLGEVPDEVLAKLASIPTTKSTVNYHKRLANAPVKYKTLFFKLYHARSGSKNIFEAFIKLVRHHRLIWNQRSSLHLFGTGALIFFEKVVLKKIVFLKKIRSR